MESPLVVGIALSLLLLATYLAASKLVVRYLRRRRWLRGVACARAEHQAREHAVTVREIGPH